MGKEDLRYCGMNMKKSKICEWAKCYGKYSLCIVGGMVCYLLTEVLGQETDSVENGVLYRNPCGQGDAYYEISVDGLEESFSVEISVPEQILSEDEFRASVPEMTEVLLSRIVGENPSLQEVCTNLELVREIPEYGVDVSWQSDCPELIGSDGTVYADESGEVFLEARLSMGSISEVLEIPIMVNPKKTSPEERFRVALEEMVFEDREQGEVTLPKLFEGKTVRYRSRNSSSNELLLFFGIVAAVCMFLKEKEDAVMVRKERETQLTEDYPNFVYEFLILTGAGYSVKAAWKKMAESYAENVIKRKRPLCQELQITINQMETGIPEIRAYMEFGRRCGNRNYVRFASLLESSISTGGKHLRNRLEEEVKEAFEMRMDIAKRKGEEASAKLLLPTFIMLGVVMVMVMAPAFLTILQ